MPDGRPRTAQDRYAHALRSLESAFGQGYRKARLDLGSGRGRPLTHAQTSFRIEVARVGVLDGRWPGQMLRFAQLGRTAGLSAGYDGTATLTASASNGSEREGPALMYWTVEIVRRTNE